jgi:hypothetical protein
MTQRERKVLSKLPAARRYLRAARWGLDALLSQKPMGAGLTAPRPYWVFTAAANASNVPGK